ncbi:MAG: antibiotic biosynthesis monooxygenase [Bacteroidia bacterium]|nr:antibiotic biosynthesis monooxygenase [Bacteroidia bacterium]
MITRLVKLTFEPQHCDAFITIFKESQSKINARKGCNGVKLLRDTLQSNVFFTQSSWVDSDALEAYRKSELFITTWARTKILFTAKPEVWSTIEINV